MHRYRVGKWGGSIMHLSVDGGTWRMHVACAPPAASSRYVLAGEAHASGSVPLATREDGRAGMMPW